MLLVGDPHVKPDNLAESEKLLEFIETQAIELNEKKLVFLGDLFHTHRIIRMDVERFWIKWATRLGKIAEVVMLVGNHDQPGDDQNEGVMSALDVLKGIPNVTVVDRPMVIGTATYLPHTSSQERFAHWASETNTPYLFCHQTFDGSEFENGFYAKDGFPVDVVSNFSLVITGHIHKTQEFKNIWIPGTPRWDSVSDANQEKGIWLFDEKSQSKKLISTESVCSKIISIEIKEGDEIPVIQENTRTHVKLTGSSSWIAKTAKKFKNGVRVSSKPTDTRFSGESRQLSSLEAYAKQFKFENSNAEEVLSYLESFK